MKLAFIVLVLIVGASCSKEETPMVEYCPGCTSTVLLNGSQWDVTPGRADLHIRDQNDTSLTIQLWEPIPLDKFSDNMIIYDIPFRTGAFVFDSTTTSAGYGLDAKLLVFEVEYGTPGDEYFVVRDGNSYVNVELLDKITGKFKLTFDLTLTVAGGIDGEVHNSRYPSLIHLEQGVVEGIYLSE